MITQHQYIHTFHIQKESQKLIVGTIHPHNHETFVLQFFYGNVLSIWKILNKAYNGEIGEPITVAGIKRFLLNQKIAITDTILECERINPTALDEDLIPTILNNGLIDLIKNSSISEILFTSGFEKNNAFKIFYEDILKLKITAKIKKDREIMLDPTIFGRPVKLTVLYSPASTANRGIARSKLYLANKNKYADSPNPIVDFRIDHYREKFQSLNTQ